LFVVGQAIIPAVAIDADLDQFVGGEAGLDFLQDTVVRPFSAIETTGIQTVGTGAQFANAGWTIIAACVNLSKTAFYRMKRTRTSKAWMQEHVNDPYVQQAKKDGWRSRAAFKLLEIDAKDKLLKRGEVVVDLGATPGGWSQVAVQRVGESGLVLALDLLEMAPIRGVHFIQGDFREDAVLTQLEEALGERAVGVVLSDMAPNMSGVPLVMDQARVMHLAELGLEFFASPSETRRCFPGQSFPGARLRSVRQGDA
jgi:23S rRNA (uridine2552-2'-O)-methyltransferase